MTAGRGKSIWSMREAVAAFLAASGLDRQNVQDQVGRAWVEAVGPETARHTQLGRTIRGGVLNVVVDSSALLSELSGFRKADILRVLQEKVKRKHISDIRFRLGSPT